MQNSVEPVCKQHRIPPEVTDRVIDHCHDDKKTLRTCSLVCKEWLLSSRYHLFSTVIFHCKNIPSFLELLESPSGSSICPLVKHLGLIVDYNLPLVIKLVPKLSNHLRPVSLRLRIVSDIEEDDLEDSLENGLEDGPGQWEGLAVFIKGFQTVIFLHVSIPPGTLVTFTEVAGIVSSFPLLRHLVFRGDWSFRSGAVFSPENFALPSHLQTLECSTHDPYIFFRWLLSHSSIPRPSTLSLRTWRAGDLTVIDKYLQELSGTLEHLSIKIDAQILSSGGINLLYLTHLRTIDVSDLDADTSIVLYLLSRVSPISIEDIRFPVWDPTTDHPMIWEQLDVLLTGPRFPKLRRVIVDVDEEYRDDVRLRLRRTNSMNILGLRHLRNEVY